MTRSLGNVFSWTNILIRNFILAKNVTRRMGNVSIPGPHEGWGQNTNPEYQLQRRVSTDLTSGAESAQKATSEISWYEGLELIRGVCIAPIPNKGSRYRHSYFRSILASKFFMTLFFCHMACCRLANWTHIWLKWIVDMACKSSHEIYIARFSRTKYKLALWRNGSMLSSRPAGRGSTPAHGALFK